MKYCYAQTMRECTPCVCSIWGELVLMQKKWEWAEEILTTVEMKIVILLPQTMRERTPGILQHIGAN